MLPTTPDAAGAAAGQRVLEALKAGERPTLILWADGDPILPLKVGERFAAALGQPAPRVIPGASHFLAEDQGPLIGETIAEWLGAA
jgi:pimeloyl-ACP methyl ester carboxylesterase